MARPDITMTDTEIRNFLASGAKVLNVATLGSDGSPHLAPMWFVMDDHKIVFRSFTKSQKVVNLARDPRLTVLVETGDAYGELQGVMIKGSATLVTDPTYVVDVYRRLAAKYPMVGDAPLEMDEATAEAAFGRYAAKNTAVIVEPENVTSWDHRKLGGVY